MPVKTITAEIDGQTRKITADIPDGASQDDIMSAVEDYVKANPAPKERHGATGSWSGFDAFLNKTGIAPQAGKAVPDSQARVTKDTPIKGGPVVFGGDIPGGIAAVRAAGSLKPLIRPAIGLVSGFGTYAAVDKAAAALNVPPLLREILATAAATGVGGKAGMPEEMQAKLKSGGLKGLLNTWLNGEPKPNDVAEFYKEKYGKLPAPGAETIKAKAEAAEFKRQLAQQLKQAADKPESVKLTPEVKAKSEERAGKVPWRNFPSTAAPEPEAPPIKPATETPSGRKPGGAANQPPNPPRNPAWRNFPSTQPTEKPPADIGIKPTGPRTPRPGTTTIPGATAPVDASKVKEAAELARSLGATPESLKSAPQSQWDGVAKQVGVKADDQFKEAVMEELKPGQTKPSPASGMRDAQPKTARPTPGKSPAGDVRSSMTKEQLAKREDEGAAKLAKWMQKNKIRTEDAPHPNDATTWMHYTRAAGVQDSPAVRQKALERLPGIWKDEADELTANHGKHFSKKFKQSEVRRAQTS